MEFKFSTGVTVKIRKASAIEIEYFLGILGSQTNQKALEKVPTMIYPFVLKYFVEDYEPSRLPQKDRFAQETIPVFNRKIRVLTEKAIEEIFSHGFIGLEEQEEFRKKVSELNKLPF